MRDDIAALVDELERRRVVPAGEHERYTGYAVMGVAFASGHVLALRRFPVTSLGDGYTSVWQRDSEGRWIFVSDRPPLESCPRYFGSALAGAVVAPIEVRWPGARRLELAIPALGLSWSLALRATWKTRFLGALGGLLPERLWRSPLVLAAMGAIAGPLLDAGRLGLSGRVPNGQRFVASPRRVWMVADSRARLGGRDLGAMQSLVAQPRLGDFWIPRRGLFAIGSGFFRNV